MSEINSPSSDKNRMSEKHLSVCSYFQDRRVVYSTPIFTREHSYSRGYSQVSCSGSLFWPLCSEPNAHSISKRANIALAKIAKWAEIHKLQFGTSKASAMLFRKPHDGGRRRAPRAPPRIHFLGTAIKAVKTQQYLGYMIDDKLNGLAHVANIRAKMVKNVLAVNSLTQRY